MRTLKSLTIFLLAVSAAILSSCTKDEISSDLANTVWIGKSDKTTISVEFTEKKNECILMTSTEGYFCALNSVMTIDWSSKNAFSLYYSQDDTKKYYYSGTIRKDSMEFNYLDDSQKITGTVKLTKQKSQ